MKSTLEILLCFTEVVTRAQNFIIVFKLSQENLYKALEDIVLHNI